MVDGILASCYADIHHDLGNLFMMPTQWYTKTMNWILGYDIGFPVYVSTSGELGKMVLPDEQFHS